MSIFFCSIAIPFDWLINVYTSSSYMSYICMCVSVLFRSGPFCQCCRKDLARIRSSFSKSVLLLLKPIAIPFDWLINVYTQVHICHIYIYVSASVLFRSGPLCQSCRKDLARIRSSFSESVLLPLKPVAIPFDWLINVNNSSLYLSYIYMCVYPFWSVPVRSANAVERTWLEYCLAFPSPFRYR